MNVLQKFFLICSGSTQSILKRTPTELNKHIGIGATIFFTAIFATLAGGYAFYIVFQSFFGAILAGLAWGAMIFNLDRYIVSTLKMSQSKFQNFMGAFPRLVLAVIIAIVIAKPLELKIFDTEIQSELAKMQQEDIINQEELIRSRFEKDISDSKAAIASMKEEIRTQELKRDELDAIAIEEADGTGGSKKRNMGPIYRAKKADAQKAQAELDELNQYLLPQIAEAQQKVKELESQMSQELTDRKHILLNGMAARLEALDRVSQESQAIYIANIFIMLLFIAIETCPIFVKLISKRSPYDYVLDKHEHAYRLNHQLQTGLLATEINNKLHYDTEVSNYKTKTAIEIEKRLIKESIDESYEQLKSNGNLWHQLFGRKPFFKS